MVTIMAIAAAAASVSTEVADPAAHATPAWPLIAVMAIAMILAWRPGPDKRG